MLLIKTKISQSNIHGIGLFADQFIPKGMIIWKFVQGFDISFTRKELEKLPDEVKIFMKIYGYKSINSGRYILCSDDARFYNHSEIPNTVGVELEGTDGEGADMTTQDILEGEEITYNYKDPEEGDGDWKEKFGIIDKLGFSKIGSNVVANPAQKEKRGSLIYKR